MSRFRRSSFGCGTSVERSLVNRSRSCASSRHSLRPPASRFASSSSGRRQRRKLSRRNSAMHHAASPIRKRKPTRRWGLKITICCASSAIAISASDVCKTRRPGSARTGAPQSLRMQRSCLARLSSIQAARYAGFIAASIPAIFHLWLKCSSTHAKCRHHRKPANFTQQTLLLGRLPLVHVPCVVRKRAR